MRRNQTLISTVLAAVGLLASGAYAATPTRGVAATDLGFVWAMTGAGNKQLAVVGCDGPYPQQTGRIQVLDVRTGAVAWDAPPPSRPACFRNVLAAGDDLFVSGDVADDDGDGGRNLLVRRYRLRDGVLLWEQELEAPNPKQDMVNTLHNSENLAVAGAKLMVWSGTTGSANPSVLLRLDRDSGALLPPAP